MRQRIVGTLGNDTLLGSDSDEVIDGLTGSDWLDGGAGDDILVGWKDGADTLIGGAGSDSIESAGRGASVEGGDGDDAIFASLGVLINGGSGNDSISAFAGSAITAGTGQDVIAPRWSVTGNGAAPPSAPILVTDFDAGTLGDRLDLAQLLRDGVIGYAGGNLIEAGYLRLWQDGADAVLDLDPDGGGDRLGTLLRLTGVSVNALTAADLGFDPEAATPLIATTRGGVMGAEHAARYKGPVGSLQYSFLGREAGEAAAGTDANEFFNLGGGDDAANGGGGDDVVDGGTGSNFLTGGAGRDVFFLDGRGGQTTWTTITDWQEGEELNIWGYQAGISGRQWVREGGVDGYRGVTLHLDLNGDRTIETLVTWAGANWERPPVPEIFEGRELLWFH
jgi:Ca2+-binding RTX toxin-like protein